MAILIIMKPYTIEFYYFEGCPSYKKALDHLNEIINEENIEADLELIRVDSPEDGQKAGFQGSPSINRQGSVTSDLVKVLSKKESGP